MFIFVATAVIISLIEAILVGIALYSLKAKYKWAISPKLCFGILIVVFVLIDNIPLPLLYVSDITITVGNAEIAKMFSIMPNEPAINLLDFGFIEWMMWCTEALIAGYVGSKLFK